MKTNNHSFKNYCYSNRYQILIVFFFLLLAYGMKVFNISISHDTEAIISVPDALYGSWLQMGRFGLIFLKKILGTFSLNPYVAGYLSLFTMLLNSVVWGYLFFLISDNLKKVPVWIFGSVCFTSVIMAEQEAFLLQSYEVTVAMIFVAIALILFVTSYKIKQCLIYMFFSSVLLMLAFSIYQAMVVLFIMGAVFCYILYYEKNADSLKLPQNLIYIFKLILLFVISYALYFVVNKIITHLCGISSTEYISDQIAWGTQPFSECIKNIIKHVIEVFSGNNFFYSKVLTVATILILIRMLIQKKHKNYWLYGLATIFLCMCPFLITIVLGARPTYRTELNIPFATAFFICLIIDSIRIKSSFFYKAGIIVVLIICMNQSLSSARLYYTEYVQNQEDYMQAIKISDRIEQLNADTTKTPVVFIGRRDANRNPSCLNKEDFGLTGYSFFEISYSSMHGSWVMQHYLTTLGINYKMPDEKQITKAEEISRNMPSWPNKGSVKYSDSVIVVKLSE